MTAMTRMAVAVTYRRIAGPNNSLAMVLWLIAAWGKYQLSI